MPEPADDVRHDVDGIRGHDQDRIGGMFDNLNDYLFEDNGIAGEEFEPGFPRTLTHAAGEDHGLRLREL